MLNLTFSYSQVRGGITLFTHPKTLVIRKEVKEKERDGG